MRSGGIFHRIRLLVLHRFVAVGVDVLGLTMRIFSLDMKTALLERASRVLGTSFGMEGPSQSSPFPAQYCPSSALRNIFEFGPIQIPFS
jgi:hypothetical protein